MNYEDALKELEKITTDLSENKLTMDEATKAFERGTELCKFCFNEINTLKGKVTVIKEELGSLLEETDENF